MNKQIKAKELEALRAQLEKRLSQLVEELRNELESQSGTGYAEVSAQVRDLGDEAAADVLMDSRLFDIQRDDAELREVRAALSRLRDGSYGICIDCGEPIEMKRLQAQPAASRCIDCQKRYEHEYVSTNPREI